MTSSDWQWTESPPRVENVWVKAQAALCEINSQCDDVEQLISGEVKDIAVWVEEACSNASTREQTGQLLSNQPDGGRFPWVLARILSRILSAAHTFSLLDNSTHSRCVLAVTQALSRVLQLSGATNPHLPGSMAVRLSLAKQLQQAELLQPLVDAMQGMEVVISEQISMVAVSINCNAAVPSGQDSKNHNRATDYLFPSTLIELTEHFVYLAVRICLLWPGAVYKSGHARQLMPAAARLILAQAQMANQLYLRGHADERAHDVIFAAYSAVHRLATINHEAVRGQSANSQEVWSLGKEPAFRHLLLLLLAVHAQLWLIDGKVQKQPPREPHAVKQLWVSLGYAPKLLSTAVNALRLFMRESDPSELNTSKGRYHPSVHMHQLANSWALQTTAAHRQSSVSATPHQPLWRQLQQESEQMLQLLKVADIIFHVGPQEIRGDLQLLVEAVECVSTFFASGLRRCLESAEAQGEVPSDAFDLCGLVQLLFRFLELGHDSVQQQRQQQDAAANASRHGAGDQYQQLQQAVLKMVQSLACFTAKHRKVACLQEVWILYGCQVTQVMEGVLLAAVHAADDYYMAINASVGPALETWLKMMTSSDTMVEALQPFWQNRLARSRPADVIVSDDKASCNCLDNNILWAAELSSKSSTAAAAADIQVDNSSSSASGRQTGQQQQHHRVGVSALELQMLSLMTSLCKVVSQSVEVAPEVPMLAVQLHSLAAYLTSATANIVEHRAVHLRQPLQHPAVRAWLSLLGRCMVMMGRRLRQMQEDSKKAQFFKDHEVVLEGQLQELQQQLVTSQLLQLEIGQMQQVQLLKQAIGKCTGEVETLQMRLAHAHSVNDQQQVEALQQQCQERSDSLQKVIRAYDKVLTEWTANRDARSQLQQQICKADGQLQLCRLFNKTATSPAAPDISLTNTVTALVHASKVLLQCRLAASEQLHSVAASNGSSRQSGAVLLDDVLQQQLPRLLRTLVVMEGLCGLLPDDSATGDSAHSGVAAVADTPSLAADALAGRYELTVKDGLGMQWSLQLLGGDEASTGFWSQLPSPAEAIAAILGDDNHKQQDTVCAGMLLPALLSSEPYQQLHEQLVSIGSELVTALPHCWCCNNPGCDNLAADSELQLVDSSNKEQVCAGCTGGSRAKEFRRTAAKYCTVECQKQHWQQHKNVCKRLHKQHKQQQ